MSRNLIIEKKPCFNNGKWSSYHLFGLTLASDFPFTNRLMPGTGRPDLTFTCEPRAGCPGGWEYSVPAYSIPSSAAGGQSLFDVYRQGNYDVLRFAEIADFFLWPEHIVCNLLDPAYGYLVEIQLLGIVLSFWLERQGTRMLHAAAAVVENQAVAFLAANSGNKTSLAATLMQSNYPLLTDDVLPVERCCNRFIGHPGYPQMRLWPDQAVYFLGHYQELEYVHPAYSKRRVTVGFDGFGTFCETSKPLGCLYLLERRDPSNGVGAIEIRPVSPGDAVIELVRHSFLATIVEAIGLQEERLSFFAQLALQVPMRRILYPSGLEHLQRVREAILIDIEEIWGHPLKGLSRHKDGGQAKRKNTPSVKKISKGTVMKI